MKLRILHDFLKWIWPALGAVVSCVIGLAIAASAIWPQAKEKTAAYFIEAVVILNSPWPYVIGSVILFLWIISFIWSKRVIEKGLKMTDGCDEEGSKKVPSDSWSLWNGSSWDEGSIFGQGLGSFGFFIGGKNNRTKDVRVEGYPRGVIDVGENSIHEDLTIKR